MQEEEKESLAADVVLSTASGIPKVCSNSAQKASSEIQNRIPRLRDVQFPAQSGTSYGFEIHAACGYVSSNEPWCGTWPPSVGQEPIQSITPS